MMTLPFLFFALAFWLASKRSNKPAIIIFIIGFILIVLLSKYHITDTLNLQF